MKTSVSQTTALAAFFAGLLLSTSAKGQTVSIIPGSSSATITFNDTNSFNSPNFGGSYNTSNPAWNGAALSLSQTDLLTNDLAQGTITALGGIGGYSVGFPSVTLTQPAPNTGFAILNFTFSLVFSITGGPSLVLAAQFPTFAVNGTTQLPGGFAGVSGSIDYIGLDASANYSILETVNYNQFFVPPPNTFSGNVLGVPVFGGPLNGFTGLPSGTTLTLNGNFTFKVDPASINATSAPEPSASLLTLLSLPLLLARRRAQRA